MQLATAFSARAALPAFDEGWSHHLQPSSPDAEHRANATTGHAQVVPVAAHVVQPAITSSGLKAVGSSELPETQEPHVERKVVRNDFWNVGVAWTQGFRPSMEDAFCVDLEVKSDPPTGLLAVFDGHGGDHCARYCAQNSSSVLTSTPAWQQGDFKAALDQTFLALDEQLLSNCPNISGTTGTVALLQGGKMIVAGVGDSKAVLLRNGRIVPMSVDHRPTAPQEEARIRCAGGFVIRGRVNACLNVSRALGDKPFKLDSFRPPCEQQVSPEPDIREADATSTLDFLLVCSDGVWNSMKETHVLRFVRKMLLEGIEPDIICDRLCQACLQPCCTAYDNITACLVTFNPAALSGNTFPVGGSAPTSPVRPSVVFRRSLDERVAAGSRAQDGDDDNDDVITSPRAWKQGRCSQDSAGAK